MGMKREMSGTSNEMQALTVAKNDLMSIIATARVIDEKMQSIIYKIQSIHEERGEEATKCVGGLTVEFAEKRGDFFIDDKQAIELRLRIEPEDAILLSDESRANYPYTILWSDDTSFPKSFEFNPILSREAFVKIDVVKKDGELESILREIEIPITSLFGKELNEWYHSVPDIYEMPTELVSDKIDESTVEQKKMNEEAVDAHEKIEEVKASTEVISETVDLDEKLEASNVQDDEDDEEEHAFVDAAEDLEYITQAIEVAAQEETEAEAVKAEDVNAEGELALAETTDEKEGNRQVEEQVEIVEKKEEKESKEQVEEPGANASAVPFTLDQDVKSLPEVRVCAKFVLSEVEGLAQAILVLSKQRNELETAKRIAQQQLALAQARHEQSQTSVVSTSSSSSRGFPSSKNLLSNGGGKGTTMGRATATPENTSFFGRMKNSVQRACTPQRVALAQSATIFVASVVMFHFQGENFAV